jgi:hypothetical protein
MCSRMRNRGGWAEVSQKIMTVTPTAWPVPRRRQARARRRP